MFCIVLLLQLTVEGMPAWIRFWCCLRQIYIYGWMFAEDEEKNLPTKVAFELTKVGLNIDNTV